MLFWMNYADTQPTEEKKPEKVYDTDVLGVLEGRFYMNQGADPISKLDEYMKIIKSLASGFREDWEHKDYFAGYWDSPKRKSYDLELNKINVDLKKIIASLENVIDRSEKLSDDSRRG